jgi:hypothetical protein
VKVIWHEAVRDYSKPLLRRSSRNLLEYQIYGGLRGEQLLALVRAERQGISVWSEIIERLEMLRTACAHARVGATCAPSSG